MPPGLIEIRSSRSFAETLGKFTGALAARGVQVFAQIDHAQNARDAGLPLPPTTVVIFGAAQAGTPLMEAHQTLGLDLPLRALIREDAAGAVFIAYNQPNWIVTRHGVDPTTFPSVAGMTKLLEAVVREACGDESAR
jgi:uncharacterized protein (DUF302 family)